MENVVLESLLVKISLMGKRVHGVLEWLYSRDNIKKTYMTFDCICQMYDKQWIEEWQPNLLVVGLPLSENNVTSDIQNYIKSFVKQLSKFNLPINMIDESYSSKEANEILILESRLGLRGKIKKEMDAAPAATLIAERWLKIK